MLPQYFKAMIRARRFGAEVAPVKAGGERAAEVLLLRRRVKQLSLKLGVLGLDLDVLDDDDFILKPHGVRRQRGGIDGTLDCLMNREVFERASIRGLTTL